MNYTIRILQVAVIIQATDAGLLVIHNKYNKNKN